MGSSGGDSVERGRGVEGGGGAESGGKTEGLPGSREGGTGSGCGRRAAAVARNRALRPQTYYSSITWTSGLSTQSKGKRKATEEGLSTSQYISLSMFHSPLTFSVGQSFCPATHAQLPASPV
jgi:hypothetical protein